MKNSSSNSIKLKAFITNSLKLPFSSECNCKFPCNDTFPFPNVPNSILTKIREFLYDIHHLEFCRTSQIIFFALVNSTFKIHFSFRARSGSIKNSRMNIYYPIRRLDNCQYNREIHKKHYLLSISALFRN